MLTIKWPERSMLEQRDLVALGAHLAAVPGASSATPLVAVSRAGVEARGAAAAFGPADLLAAWA